MSTQGNLRAYIVRMVDNKQLVGVFAAASTDALEGLVDECTECAYCEYMEVPFISVIWPGDRAPALTDDGIEYQGGENDDGDGGYVSDTMLGHIAEWHDAADWVPFTPGRVYFIKSGDLVKIGYTTNVDRRLRGLQTGSPHKLEILLTHPGSRRDEQLCHEQFAHLRVQGEWFRYSDDLLAYLESFL